MGLLGAYLLHGKANNPGAQPRPGVLALPFSFLFVPVAIGIVWVARQAATLQHTRLLQLFLCGVMAGFAKALQIFQVVKQFLIAVVPNLMISNGCRCKPAFGLAINAQWLTAKLHPAKLVPPPIVV